jgi:hypothetical protein
MEFAQHIQVIIFPENLSQNKAEEEKETKKKVSRIRKKTFYLQFCMETPEGHQKSLFNTSKVTKKNKDT